MQENRRPSSSRIPFIPHAPPDVSYRPDAATGIGKVAAALLASPWLADLLGSGSSPQDPPSLASHRRLARKVTQLRDALQRLDDLTRLLAREDAMVETAHPVSFGTAVCGLLGCTALESFAAYPAAASAGLDLVVTAGIGIVIVASVVGLAALIAHSSRDRQPVFVGLAALLLAVLWVGRFRYASAFGDLGDAVASATALSLVSLVVLVISHALWERMESAGRWQVRRRAPRRPCRAGSGGRRAGGGRPAAAGAGRPPGREPRSGRVTTSRSMHRLALASAIAATLAACGVGPIEAGPRAGAAGTAGTADTAAASSPRVLIALACSEHVAAERALIEEAVGGTPTPREAVIVIGCSGAARASTIHVVRKGENLTEIAAANRTTLAEVERLNPGLGPPAGRDWNLVVPGDLVVLPATSPGPGARYLLVTQSPPGPPPPRMLPTPTPLPGAATDYQRTSYAKARGGIDATNNGRLAAWRDEQGKVAQQWQRQALSQLGSLDALTDDTDLTVALPEAAATAEALGGPTTLLALVDSGPPASAPSLAGLRVIVFDLSSSPAVLDQWKRSADAAGASSVSTLTTAAAELSLGKALD
jgi:hypothetical protein